MSLWCSLPCLLGDVIAVRWNQPAHGCDFGNHGFTVVLATDTPGGGHQNSAHGEGPSRCCMGTDLDIRPLCPWLCQALCHWLYARPLGVPCVSTLAFWRRGLLRHTGLFNEYTRQASSVPISIKAKHGIFHSKEYHIGLIEPFDLMCHIDPSNAVRSPRGRRSESLPSERLVDETRFHDCLFTEGNRKATSKFYVVAGPASRRYCHLIEAHGGRGKDVLELGCGTGRVSVRLARRGARVVGVDVSSESLRRAAARARDAGLGSDNPVFERMDAEALTFPDARFDLIVGSGILHHLDLGAVCQHLPRVLRPGGRAIFLEPLGHNALINLYRHLTPTRRTAHEHPLRIADLDMLARPFNEASFDYHVLCALAAVPLRSLPGFGRILAAIERVDAALLSLPIIRRFAWQVVVHVAGPGRDADPSVTGLPR